MNIQFEELSSEDKDNILNCIVHMVNDSGQAGCFDDIFDLLDEYGLLGE